MTRVLAAGILFFTERHEDSPVLLQSPTPSPSLRASSLIGDLVRLTNSMRSRPVLAAR